MLRTLIAIGVAAVLLLPARSVAVTLETHARVVMVPRAEVRWDEMDTSWRMDTQPDGAWQVRLEARRPDGTLASRRIATPTGHPAPSIGLPEDLDPALARTVRLVICRE